MRVRKQAAKLASIGETLQGFEKLFLGPVEKETNIDSAERRIWAEPQLFLLPLCVPQDKKPDRYRSVEISETIAVNGKIKTKVFRVNPDPRYGLPGLFELEVMLMIYQLASEYLIKHGLVPEQFEIGSLSSFLRLMKRSADGRYIGMLKEGLKRLAATNCVSEGFFYSKTKDIYVIESFQFISAVHIAGEDDHNGGRFEKTTVKLHPLIRDNLNAKFRTLINADFIRELKTDIAKPLCLHLSYRFYLASLNKTSYWDTDYAWLCGRLGIRIYSEQWQATKQLKPALEELQARGFIASWEWLESGKLRFMAGKAYVDEHAVRMNNRDQAGPLVAPNAVVAASSALDRGTHDPLIPICALYSANGWTELVQKKAKDMGLAEADLKRELLNRPELSQQL